METRNPVVCEKLIFWPKHKNVVELNWNFYKKARKSKSRTVLRYIKNLVAIINLNFSTPLDLFV